MADISPQMEWLRTGKQRIAIAQVLRRPLTQSELLRLAREKAPSLQMGDLWVILRQAIACGVAECLNPDEQNGKVFFYTAKGREAARQLFNLEFDAIPADMDWNRYARVIRARARRELLVQLARSGPAVPERNTAEGLREQLRARNCPLAIAVVGRALRALQADQLVRSERHKGATVFFLTHQGALIANELQRSTPAAERVFPNGSSHTLLNFAGSYTV